MARGSGERRFGAHGALAKLVSVWLPVQVDVFSAVADPVRRGLLDQLARGGPARVVDLTAGRGISRPAVSRHLRLLGEAGLVSATERGRERHYELTPGPLREVAGWAGALVRRPPVAAHELDALDLEVRRTVRERSTGAHADRTAKDDRTGQIA